MDTSPAITRSAGREIGLGFQAGAGFSGVTEELDALVAEAAQVLAAAYGADVEIRFNTDRESGGAFLATSRDRSDVGIGVSIVTARACRVRERYAAECQAMADTGICTWGGTATESQREGAAACAREWRETLARSPEGQITICAHLRRRAVAPELHAGLAALAGWNDMSGSPAAYHHGPAGSIAEALTRCLRFVPPGTARQHRQGTGNT